MLRDKSLNVFPVLQNEAATRPGMSHGAFFAVFVGLHIPLGLVLHSSPTLAQLHAIATTLLGIVWALRGTQPQRVAFVGAYIAGAEVLWRMVDAPIFWESGKYFTIAVLVVALFRSRDLKLPARPLLAFLLLVPPAFITLGLPWQTARNQLSFYMSGPLALLVTCWFFASVRLSRRDLLSLLLTLLGPIVSIATIALYTLTTTPDIVWTTESNFAASGGFGPNQASSILGWGLLMVILILLHYDTVGLARLLLTALAMWLAVQSLLTFSRGGVLTALLSVLAIGSRTMLRKHQRFRTLLVITGGLAFYILALPQLDQLTSGMFTYRFSDLNTTGRDRILEAELEVFAANPLWGVGPGNGAAAREAALGLSVAAHTEYSRLLSEHGLLGAGYVILMASAAWTNVRRQDTPIGRDLVLVMGLWTAVYFTHSAFRLVAPAYALGLTFVTLSADAEVMHP
jgi:O-antigen ligase